MEWFASKGAGILAPIGHSPKFDFVAEVGDELLRIQVKTCTHWVRNRWNVTLCTRGGNQSWNGIVKRLERSSCDYVFVVVGDGRRWCIPAGSLDGGSRLSLGGPKYSEFEVEPGRPLPPRTDSEPASTIVSLGTRGDVRAAKGDAL
jgi:hypothetical protein